MYADLEYEAHKQGIEIIEMHFNGKCKGLYSDNIIAIDKNIHSEREKSCILAEELGHHYTSFGEIMGKHDLESIKQEKRARNWGYEKLIGIVQLINAYKSGAKTRFEIADYLNVTELFLNEALEHYKEKYGISYEIDNYIVYFEPLGILEMFR